MGFAVGFAVVAEDVVEAIVRTGADVEEDTVRAGADMEAAEDRLGLRVGRSAVVDGWVPEASDCRFNEVMDCVDSLLLLGAAVMRCVGWAREALGPLGCEEDTFALLSEAGRAGTCAVWAGCVPGRLRLFKPIVESLEVVLLAAAGGAPIEEGRGFAAGLLLVAAVLVLGAGLGAGCARILTTPVSGTKTPCWGGQVK